MNVLNTTIDRCILMGLDLVASLITYNVILMVVGVERFKKSWEPTSTKQFFIFIEYSI